MNATETSRMNPKNMLCGEAFPPLSSTLYSLWLRFARRPVKTAQNEMGGGLKKGIKELANPREAAKLMRR
jgi:hypothetical protein